MATYSGSDRTSAQASPLEADLTAQADQRVTPARAAAQVRYEAVPPALWRAIDTGSPSYQEGSPPSGVNPVIIGDSC